MSQATDFAQLQRLPPAEAIAYMAGRDLTGETYHWYDLWRSEHERAFTVSRLARADLLEAFQASLSKSVAGDLTRRDWIRDTEQLLKDAGWWGRVEVTDPRTGQVLSTRFNHARLQLIFDTNTRQAAAAGQWARLLRNKRTQPYARYVAMDDDRTRPQHRAWNNVTLPLDDPWWATHRPPNGYRCRCRIVGVSQREYDQGGVSTRPGAETDVEPPVVKEPMVKTAPKEVMRPWRNPATGEVHQVPDGIDPGFDYNAGTKGASLAFEEMVRNKLLRLSPPVRAAAQREGVLPPKIAKEVPGQDTWEKLGLPDLRTMAPRGETPALLDAAGDEESAVKVLREALGVPEGGLKLVQTPIDRVAIVDGLLPHVIEKRSDRRERFAPLILPTLRQPDEVWSTRYDDDTNRRRFIKLFGGTKYDMLVIVFEQADGSVLWNMIPRKRGDLNDSRRGKLLYRAGDGVNEG